MLTRYAERRGYRWEPLGSGPNDGGGFKDVTFADQGRRRLLRLQVRGRDAPGAARARDGVAGADPHVHGDRRGHARGRGGRRRARPERPQDRRLPLDGARRPEREHDRLGRPDHAPPDRDRRRDAGREVAAPEQAEGAARPARAAARGRAAPAAGGALGAAALADRQRRPRGEDPHVQLSREPRHRPSHQAHASPAGRDPRRRPRASSPRRSRQRSAAARSRLRQRRREPARRGARGRARARRGRRALPARRRGASRGRRARNLPLGALRDRTARWCDGELDRLRELVEPAARTRAARLRPRGVGLPAAAC